ncbi:MAG TPA: DUF3347 domain-containing protein, partial [Planctomycetes bacterium]|nr:DUF3347 domain-containing protein [Planctomycetota bacterium]
PLAQALADDDFARARKAAADLVAAAQGQPPIKHARWEREQANLARILEQMAGATDIGQLRMAFALLSDQMSVLLETFGRDEAGRVYQLHCPMAFQGRGAVWLQDKKEAANPYFGSSMRSCTDRVTPIEEPSGAAPAPQAEKTADETRK